MLSLDSHHDKDSFDAGGNRKQQLKQQQFQYQRQLLKQQQQPNKFKKTHTTVVAINKDVCRRLSNPSENWWGKDCVKKGLVLCCQVQNLGEDHHMKLSRKILQILNIRENTCLRFSSLNKLANTLIDKLAHGEEGEGLTMGVAHCLGPLSTRTPLEIRYLR